MYSQRSKRERQQAPRGPGTTTLTLGSAFIAAVVGSTVSSYVGAKKQSKAISNAAEQARLDALTKQVQDAQRAKEQQEQVERQQADNQAFEVARQQQAQANAVELQRQAEASAAERQRQLEAQAKQTANETATAAQNQRVSDLTPTVLLASDVGGSQSNEASRKRRATFRPEYASGVTI